MNGLRREILNQVAAGEITPEEGASRLETMEATLPAPSGESRPPAAASPAMSPRRVRVTTQFGAAEIVGDPSVAHAIAEGPHTARQEGDTMVIDYQLFDEADSFTFGHGDERHAVVGGFDWHGRKLQVRMNPDLELAVTAQAGNVTVDGVHGAIVCEALAGNCRISDFRGPLSLTVQAGNIAASGRLDRGESKVRCEMGSVKVGLEKGSSVRIAARTQLGKIAIEGAGAAGTGKTVMVGTGAGTLDIDCTMGNVRVTVE